MRRIGHDAGAANKNSGYIFYGTANGDREPSSLAHGPNGRYNKTDRLYKPTTLYELYNVEPGSIQNIPLTRRFLVYMLTRHDADD